MTMQHVAPSHLEYAADAAPDHFLALYAQHAETARALASRLLFDPTEAEDVVQDVFLRLWHNPTCFDPSRGTGRAWLLTVVRNRSLDRLRRRALRPRDDVADLAERLPDPHASDVLEELTSAARAELLWQLVAGLPVCQADLVRRAFIRGQTHQEMAQETGLPLGTVKSRIRLALDKLRCGLRSATLADVDG
jgi:RNA polymerase sigma-70 factor (ECF subfamily)